MRSVLGITATLAIIGALSWECLAIIGFEYRIWLPPVTGWVRSLSLSFGPPLLAALSVFARSRARRWRRMEDMRDRWPGGASGRLARGQIGPVQHSGSKTMLESLCGLSIYVSLAAIPYWMDSPEPGRMLIVGLVVIWIIHRLLR